ncbi:MAG: polysaccharide deacetylase family protein [Clostridium sp.]|nr:polysaccharide deacetylase family protein [Clostridium sp.]
MSSDTSKKEKAKNRKNDDKKEFFLFLITIIILILVFLFIVNQEDTKTPKETGNVTIESATNESITNKDNKNFNDDKKETQSISENVVNDKSDNKENIMPNVDSNVNDSKTKYSYGKYTISQSDAPTENIGFWFGRNKDFKRPEGPLSIEDFKKYNSYYLGPDEKVIYLTFDEGLDNTQAEKNMDTLKKHNIKGTFFVTKGFIEANTDIVKRMVNEGHVVGNHTYNHPNMAQTAAENPEQFIKELAVTEDTFKELIGTEMDKVLRFPEGTFNECAMDYANQMGYKSIFWSFAYKDWAAEWNDKEYALEWMKNYSHQGAIYLLHGVNVANADALDEFITYMEGQGYRFDVVTNLN